MRVARRDEHDPGIAAGPFPGHPMPAALERMLRRWTFAG